MYVKKKIFLFLLIGGVTVIQAQKNEKFTPPEMTQKTHTFALPELQIDSTFITNLNTVLSVSYTHLTLPTICSV